MKDILCVCEINKQKIKRASFEIISCGKSLGDQVSAVLIGEGASAQAPELAKYGADTIYVNEEKEFLPFAYAKAIASLVTSKNFKIVLFSHTTYAKEVAGRLGALLNAGQISEAMSTTLEGDRVIGEKPIHSGKILAKLKISTPIQIITIRQNSHEIKEASGSGNIKELGIDTSLEKIKKISFKEKTGERISLAEANIIVSGGRGLKEASNYKLVEELADILGAGTGATRSIVDAGWVDHTLQIGQTGETVSPELYLALGISGAIQHLAGMSSSKYIVAVNKDPEAPIFQVATYGLVDDLFAVVPLLKKELQKLKG